MPFDSYPDLLEIQQVSGLLFWGTTSLANEAGWGTKLGFVEKGVHWRPNHGYTLLSGEVNGDEPTMMIYTGPAGFITAVLKNYNTSMLSVLFPGLVDGTSVKIPNSIKPGTDIMNSGSYANYLLFVPEDRTNHPCILFQKATPHIVATAEIKYSHVDRSSFPVIFTASRKSDDADGIAYVGALSGAALR